MPKPGSDFERAVQEFVRGLDPNARCLFNHRIPDRDTGRPRQVDGWIETSFLGHYPTSILISCKDHRRRLDVGAIEQFAGEIQSTGATFGIIYSRSGFTGSAIEKGRQLNISCCRLLENGTPEHPAELLVETFLVLPEYAFQVEQPSEKAPCDLRWPRVGPMAVEGAVRSVPVVDGLSVTCREMFDRANEMPISVGRDDRPRDLAASLLIPAAKHHPRFRIRILLVWHWFRAKLDAYRLSGSVNQSQQTFSGTTVTPVISLTSPPAMTAWDRVAPTDLPKEKIGVTITPLSWPVPQTLRTLFGESLVFQDGPWRCGPPGVGALDQLLLQGSYAPSSPGMQLRIPIQLKPR